MKKLIIILIIAFLTPVAVFAQDNQQSNQEPSPNPEGYNPDYNILPITLVIIMFYIISYLFYDNKNIKRRTFKQLWSVVLVFSFLFVGISGIILSILSDYNLTFPSGFNLLFWHVEFGIILSITIILHVHIHWKRFLEIINTGA